MNQKDEPKIPGGWTRWPGGECPEDARGRLLELIFRDGITLKSKVNGENWRWTHYGDPDDIVAYRILKPAQPEPTDGQFSAADMSDARAAGYRDGIAAIRPAAMAVVKRWQSPDWAREREHTSELIERLRLTVDGEGAASSQPPVAVPEGYVLLPVTATPEMLSIMWYPAAKPRPSLTKRQTRRAELAYAELVLAAGELAAVAQGDMDALAQDFDAWHDAKRPEPELNIYKIQWRSVKAMLREAWDAGFTARRLAPPRSDAPAGDGAAMPEPPKPAGNAIDGLLATARPFLAEELLLKQGYTWSGSGWVAPAAKHEGETRDEKIARVRTGLREHAKRFRDPIELAQEIHGTAPRETVGNVESLASALATAHTQWGAKSSETRGSLYAHMAKAIFDRIQRANSREAAALARLVPVGWTDAEALSAFKRGPDFNGQNVPVTIRHKPIHGDVLLYTLTPRTGTEESGDA